MSGGYNGRLVTTREHNDIHKPTYNELQKRVKIWEEQYDKIYKQNEKSTNKLDNIKKELYKPNVYFDADMRLWTLKKIIEKEDTNGNN